MHREAFSAGDHNNDKEWSYGHAKQNATYTSLAIFFSVTLIKDFSAELLPELFFSETANIDIT